MLGLPPPPPHAVKSIAAKDMINLRKQGGGVAECSILASPKLNDIQPLYRFWFLHQELTCKPKIYSIGQLPSLLFQSIFPGYRIHDFHSIQLENKMKRRVFYGFHFKPDNWRAAKVRNIGAIEGNKPATDNEWEDVKKGGDNAIKRWVADQMRRCTCTVVLVGSNTANRKWINHEIIKSWNDSMGIVGIYIHGLKDSAGEISKKGDNPFSYIDYGNNGKKLFSIVRCYGPFGNSSQEQYEWIEKNLANIIEEAIQIRGKN